MSIKRWPEGLKLGITAVGGILGSSWLLAPLYAARIAGPGAILSWIFSGLIMMVVLLCYAELSAMHPSQGGIIRYAQNSHGTLFSFGVGWLSWLAMATIAPIETLAIMNYAAVYLPDLIYHHSTHVPILTDLGLIIAAVLMLIMCAINVLGMKLMARYQSMTTFLKIAIPLLVIIALFCSHFDTRNFHLSDFSLSHYNAILYGISAGGVMSAFIGYNPVKLFNRKLQHPRFSIPCSIIVSMLICMVIYALLQMVFIGAVAHHDIHFGWYYLVFNGDSGPFATLALSLGALWLTKIIFLDAAIIPFTMGVNYTRSTARTTYSMGKTGSLPKRLIKLNVFGAPARIIILNYICGLALFFMLPTWQRMVAFCVAAIFISYTVGPLCLQLYRQRLPNQKRPFKVPYATAFSLVAFYLCNVVIIWTSWLVLSKLLVCVIFGYAVLGCYKLTRSGRKLSIQYGGGWWFPLYIVSICFFSIWGAYLIQSRHISAAWAFLVLAVITAVIYYLAQFCGKRLFNQQSLNSETN